MFTRVIMQETMLLLAARAVKTIMQRILILFIAAPIKVAFTSAIIQDKMLSLLARAVYVITKQFFAIFCSN
jgi:hypothetical protein